MKQKLFYNRSSVLLITLLFLLVLVVMSATLFNIAVTSGTNSQRQADNVQALYLAEAGVNKAVFYLLNNSPDNSTNGSWRTVIYPTGSPMPSVQCARFGSPTSPCYDSLAGSTYTMWVQDSSPDIKITSCGLYNGVSRTVQVVVTSLSTQAINYITGSTPTTVKPGVLLPVAGSSTWNEPAGAGTTCP
ncbi:MAG: hypothetical protein WCH62_09125 [Candidatus Omnitrophota bacterium]